MVYLRSPELAQQLRKVGRHVRFKSSLLRGLKRIRDSRNGSPLGSYEWFAHPALP